MSGSPERLSADPVERLHRLRAECARLAEAVLAGDAYRVDDPGLTGRTAHAWHLLRPRVNELSAALAAVQQVLDRATELARHATADGPSGPPARTQLASLLDAECELVLIAATGGPAEVLRLSLDELLGRAATLHAEIMSVVDTIQVARTTLDARLAPLTDRLAAVTPRFAAVHGPAGLLAEVTDVLAALTADATADPLGTAASTSWPAERDRLAARLGAVEEQLARAEAASVELPGAIVGLRRQLDRLARAEAAAGQVWHAVTAVPGEAAPVRPTPRAGQLRGQLRQLEQHCQRGHWWAVADAAPGPGVLAAEVARAITAAAEDHRQGQDHRRRVDTIRAELRGRLEAYRHKASNLSRAEDLALTERYDEARRLLGAVPFDASAADRAVWRYQSAVNEVVRD